MKELTSDYWNSRYEADNTPWNIGYLSPPIKNYIDKLEDKDVRILIPGAGHAHEAVYLKSLGFTHIFVCDWAVASFDNLNKNCPDFPAEHQIVSDFFKLEMEVDLIIEQTFFSAINPRFREDYAQKVSELLSAKGRLAGLLFSEPFKREGPPYGGTKEEYKGYFEPYFNIKRMDDCLASIKPRLGNELFMELEKK